VHVALYNIGGQRVSQVGTYALPRGVQHISWTGLTAHETRIVPGVYVLHVDHANGQQETARLIVLR
jgi:hypothetical protein